MNVLIRHPKEGYFEPSLSQPPTSHSAHLVEVAHTQPCDVWVPHGIEGEYKCSVLGEYSFNKEGIRVKTANVRRCSSSKGEGQNHSPFLSVQTPIGGPVNDAMTRA